MSLHPAYAFGFRLDHILTANTIDDGHWFSDESEGIVICMYFINFC